MKRLCFTCNLQDDPQLIAQYKAHHQSDRVWPEITKSIRDAGVLKMEIYHVDKRLFMIMDVEEDFDLETKMLMDSKNPQVQKWEKLMENFQEKPDFARNGEKWVLMECIYELED